MNLCWIGLLFSIECSCDEVYGKDFQGRYAKRKDAS